MEKKIETVMYGEQPLRYYHTSGDLYFNVADLSIIMDISESTISPSKLEYVMSRIALGTAYQQPGRAFHRWLNQKFYGSGSDAADITV